MMKTNAPKRKILKAHFVTVLFVSASNISSGIVSPQARSYTITLPPSMDTPNSKISKLSDSAYL